MTAAAGTLGASVNACDRNPTTILGPSSARSSVARPPKIGRFTRIRPPSIQSISVTPVAADAFHRAATRPTRSRPAIVPPTKIRVGDSERATSATAAPQIAVVRAVAFGMAIEVTRPTP